MRDRGAASLFVLAIGLVLVSAGMAGAAVGAVRVGRQQARTAADLGALAAAMRVVEGSGAACARAAEIVGRNGARLTACRVAGLDVEVTAGVGVTPLPGLTGQAVARARAGPVADG
ncbi:Rv3654c family TadE-like protein [Actinoplanes sp. N902-109]|uniref:Rv3654c family TadE-like protein n=1 Tax=Actinoplanes sp. (strain N902-109) TaxID=649831 RepID=UPI0005A28339|nr:Rv3654c family TadE-like protein [Actinoplanes sp. N902-109]